MQTVKEALRKEADNWLTADHTIGDWCTHCLMEPSDELTIAYQNVDMSCEDADEDEEFEDAMEQLFVEAFNEANMENV